MKLYISDSAFFINAQRRLRPLLCMLVLLMSTILATAQQQNSFALAIPGQNLSFLNVNRTLISGSGLTAGSVWRYDNLITTNGITIYGLLRIKEISSGTTLAVLDDETAGTGLPGRFQPRITTTNNTTGGTVLFELEFYEVTTNNRAYISEYYFTAVDIDGSEVVEIGGYSTYQIDATSGLTITQQPSGRTRFGGITTDLNNITFENTAAFVAQYKFPYTKVTFALGKSNAGTSRQFSIQFGTAGGTFSNPTTVRNPVKLMYINKKADTDNFVAGTTRKYTVEIDNIGATSENVTLTDPLPAGLTYVPNTTSISVPAITVNESVADNFNSVSYARNNGTAWWKNDWTEIGETSDASAGQISINNNALRFATLSNGRGIERSVDLSKASAAILSFAYTQSSTVSGILDVQISPNGSSYISVGTISGNTSGNFSANIPIQYFTNDTRIRLVNSSGSNWGNKTTTVDNLVLQYTLSQPSQNKTNALSGGSLVNGAPPNLIVSGDNITLLPGAKATVTFDVTVNCNAQGTITNTATASTPGLYEDTISAFHTAYVNPVNVTGGSRCDTGTVTLTASGAQGNQEYRWYTASTGGSPVGTDPSFTTPNLSSTTTYYVSFYNPTTGCETGRTSVVATVSSSSITGTGSISSTTNTAMTFGDSQSSVNFNITGISGATGYTWTVPAGATIIAGQGTSSILVNFNNAVAAGIRSVCATPINACVTGLQVCQNITITDTVNNEISGTVYNDPDGSSGSGKVDGTPISQIAGRQLYAVLTLNSGPFTAISSVTIAPDGTYKFSYLPNTTTNAYRIFIKTMPYGDGVAVPTSSDLPQGATFNGAIDNNATNSLPGGSTTNGYLNVTAGNNTNNTNVNFGIKVDNPVTVVDTATTLEDTSVTFNIITNDSAGSGTLSGNAVDLDPSTSTRETTYTTVNGTWTVDNNGLVTFTPVPDFFGTDSISYTVANSSGYLSNHTSITVTVTPVNDAPSFTKGADQTHTQSSAATSYSVPGWATNISKGPANESTQNVSFIVTNTNNALFTVQPTVLPNGDLQYTVAPNASGTATISVRIQDDGGTANGGVNTSPIQTFTITINSSRCYKPAVTNGGITRPTQHGVTALARAGTNNGNWPMVRQSAWTAIESKERGFVVNRVPTTTALSGITAVIGMMVYDNQAQCLKIYAIKEGETSAAWHCFVTPACPD